MVVRGGTGATLVIGVAAQASLEHDLRRATARRAKALRFFGRGAAGRDHRQVAADLVTGHARDHIVFDAFAAADSRR